MTLPVCWCGDPGTFALDRQHPVGVSSSEALYVWTGTERGDVLCAARCRAHAGPFAAEVTDGQLVAVQLLPIDDTPWDGP